VPAAGHVAHAKLPDLSGRLSDGGHPHVVLKKLNKSFGPLRALRDIDFAIARGELFSLLGSSGCGKTTLLRALAGFVTCESGEILIDGRDVSSLPPYLRPVNMMFQSYALFPHMTIEDNIAFGLKREGVKGAEVRRRVGEALDLIQMASMRRRMPNQLSGGQRQRVALARAIIKRPDVLLLDEPLSALDKKLRESTRLELIAIQEQVGITFVMVTHDQEEALTMSTRIAVMAEGAVVQIGTPQDIYERPATRFVADFIGSVNLFDAVVTAVRPGLAVLACEDLTGEIVAPNRGFAQGEQVTLAIRPEQMRLSDGAELASAADMEVPGAVVAHAYIGDKRLYQIRLASGRVVQVAQPVENRDTPAFARDTPVRLAWGSGASILVGR
jgi:putrescine transport system ATP-binding protein